MAESSRSAIQATIDRASQPSFSSVELVHVPFDSWPMSPDSELHEQGWQKLHISVLDSSFNPPHLAHLGLATSSFPPPYPSQAASSTTKPPDPSITPSRQTREAVGYNARLLLLSLRNVDKTPAPGDPSTMQKLEMVILLAEHIDQHHPIWSGTAGGLLTEPTFVGKSRLLRRFLRDRSAISTSPRSSLSDDLAQDNMAPEIALSFIVGTDTLVRFFDPKYYPTGEMDRVVADFFDAPPAGDGSYLISARRGEGETSEGLERELLSRQEIALWAEKGCVRLMGTAGEGREDISSTDVRRAVKAGDFEALERLVIPSIAEYIQREGLYST